MQKHLFLLKKQKNTNCQKAFIISHVLKYDSINICRIVFSSNKYRKHKDFLTPTMTNEILWRSCLTVSAQSAKHFGKFGPETSHWFKNIPYLYMREHVNNTHKQLTSFLFSLTHNNISISVWIPGPELFQAWRNLFLYNILSLAFQNI